MKRNLIAIVTLLLVALSEAAFAIPAFPGAEGFGANTVGGRGGTVIKVTNLNDSGNGSLRAAVTASGPRIVVFEVSGIINLQSILAIRNPFITIAGQTSPGGILVTGNMTLVETSEVIIRHMRFRVGSHGSGDREQLDSLDIWGGDGNNFNENIIVDHCSVGWGVDENFSTAYTLRNVTISNNLVHEGLTNAGHPKGNHSKGLFVWGKFSPDLTITLYRNFMAHNYDRNPLINYGVDGRPMIIDAVNNVEYNHFGGYAMGTQGNGININWRHNFSKGGRDSNANFYEIYHEAGGGQEEMIYVLGNMGENRTTQDGDEWLVASGWQFSKQSEAYRRNTPFATAGLAGQVMSPAVALDIVNTAGATRPFRDSVDEQMASDFANGTGTYRRNVSYPADFPTYQNLPAPADNDNDGMADAWESQNGLNPATNDSAGDLDGDGYTNIEEYLHFLADDVELLRPEPPTNLSTQPG